MQDRFVDFIQSNNLFSESDKILLGVSGGIDSMVMLNLLRKSGFSIAVAHCNFSLRGDESDGDQQLVEHVCEEFGIKLHSIRFQTELFAIENKQSIQVAARNLRYSWFNKLCDEFGYSKIAIAHNRDDVAETVLLNLTRGTGIKGLTGIKPKNENIIRPLLFAGRDEITRYAIQNAVKFREDSSNASTKYARNRIRHNVLPELEKLNPSAKKSIAETAIHVQGALSLVEDYLKKVREKLIVVNERGIQIPIQELRREDHRKLFLIEELVPLGFSYDTTEDIIGSLDGQPGKVFYSSSHQILRDREFLILTERKEVDSAIVLIDEISKTISFPINLKFSVEKYDKSYKITKSSKIAILDYNKLKFPLTLRHWQPGDRFIPFGMEGYKKISDFLIDQKVSLLDKENIFVLESVNDIVWVVGYRIDNRYKVSDKTKQIFIIESL